MPKISKQSSKPIQSGICVYLYHDIDSQETQCHHVFQEYDRTFISEDLCFIIAEHLKISSLAFPLFALKHYESAIWLPPNEKIECSSNNLKEYIFRIRFVPPESHITTFGILDKHAFNYLFLQVRDDFIHDRIRYPSNSNIGQEHLLGMGIIDLIRFGKERAYDLVLLQKQDPHYFIPNSTKGVFKNFLDKQRLKMTFKPHIEREYSKYLSETDLNIKLTYIDGILNYAENYGMEKFLTQEKKEEVFVKPYDEKYSGLNIHGESEHFHSEIEELMDISITDGEPCIVHINRKTGVPRLVRFSDRPSALSFVSFLDGHYRLQVDYHHHLCRDVESPLLVSLRQIRCHGPVSKDWAADRLRDKFKMDHEFNFLIKQKEKELGSFVLVCLVSGDQTSEIKFWPIVRLSNGHYQLSATSSSEPEKNSIRELVEYYRTKNGNHALHLKKCVPPSNPIDSKVYLCRKVVAIDHSNSGMKLKQQKAGICLVSLVEYGKLFSQGYFTKVFNSTWEKETGERVEAVAKQLKPNCNHQLPMFSQSIHQAAFWCDPTIVALHAICLSNPLTVVMEKAPLGTLDRYLCEPLMDLKVYHLVVVAEQIAQALRYLQESLGEVHGNIRCRNILVFRHEQRSSLVVKLSDPGLIHWYNALPADHEINIERLPWIAPECYSQLKNMTLGSDLYSFGIALWEMFSTGQRPWEGKAPNDIQYQVSHGFQLAQPQMCPDDIYSIMRSCWDPSPEFRMYPKEIVRNIRSLLTKEGDIYNEYSDLDWFSKPSSKRSDKTTDGFTNGSAGSTTSSKLASLDNDINLRRLKQTLPQARRPPTRQTDVTPTQPSPSSDISILWDSRTPLIKQGSETASECFIEQIPPTSPTLSGGSNWSGNTERTEICDYDPCATTQPTEVHCDASRVESIQSRPLPQVPHVTAQLSSSRLKWDVRHTLGQGHYGEVYAGTYTLDSGIVQPVAIKCLKSRMYNKFATEFEKEFRIMIRLQHENIVRIIGQCAMKDEVRPMLLVMEFVEKGCLRDFLPKKKSELDERKLLKFGREIAQGMTYLSSEHIVHRDLATRNILVTKEEHMKISDFGLSRALSQERDYYKCDGNKELPAPWCAPESLTQRKFSEKSDVWSFGVTLWEIFSFGDMPSIGKIEELVIDLHSGKRLKRPKDCPHSIFKVMMYSCWQYYAYERQAFAQILDELQSIERTLSVSQNNDNSDC